MGEIPKPLYRQLHQRDYLELLSAAELWSLDCIASPIRAARPRTFLLKSLSPEIAIHADAAASTALLAKVVVDVDRFSRGPSFASLLVERADMSRPDIFSETTLIYGLEMLAAIEAIFDLMGFVADRSAAFYVDNTNTNDAIVKDH